MNFVKKLFSLFIFTTLVAGSSYIIANDLDDDDFDFGLDINEITPINLPNTQTRANNDDLLPFLVPVVENIKTPLWNHTKSPKGRDALYLIPNKLLAIEYGGAVLNLFFNYTNKMNFSIDEALKLTDNQEAINSLETFLVHLINDTSASEASAIMPLFKKLTIQERKGGGLIQAGFITGPFTFQLNTSLQVSERNFWLSKGDQEELSSMFKGADSTFDKKELYLIKYGLGDTRLKAGLNSLNMSSFKLDVGFEGIFPTSKISSIPRLKAYDINLDNFQTTLPDVLKSIRDNLITPRLGNGGHFGLGCYTEAKVDLFHNAIQLWGRLSFDNLFSAKEDRLIASKQTITKVDPLELLADPEYMTKFLKEFVFPPAYQVVIQPGGIFNFVLSSTFNVSKRWGLGIGYDYYLEQKELFENVYNIEDGSSVDTSSLRVDDAQQPSSSQHKIFAEANYTRKQRGWDLLLGLGGDYTISSKRMGHDWTLFLRLGAAF